MQLDCAAYNLHLFFQDLEAAIAESASPRSVPGREMRREEGLQESGVCLPQISRGKGPLRQRLKIAAPQFQALSLSCLQTAVASAVVAASDNLLVLMGRGGCVENLPLRRACLPKMSFAGRGGCTTRQPEPQSPIKWPGKLYTKIDKDESR